MKGKICGIVLGICLGTIVGILFFTNNRSLSASGETEKPPLSVRYDINESGQTYGTLANQENPPELVQVRGVNGLNGYAYLKDLRSAETGWEVQNPEEAMVYMESLKARNGEDIIIPVYESDGKTVIDTFAISTGIEDARTFKGNIWD